MKPHHAGTNYKSLIPFIRKVREGQNVFRAGLGLTRLIIDDQGATFQSYGHVFRIGYANQPDKYYEIAVNDEQKTVTPLRYVDRAAVSMDNTRPDLKEVSCFWFTWNNPGLKPEAMRMVDTMLWEWLDYLIHRQYYKAKYAI